MNGIDAQTGKALGGIAHLRQSVADILTTPVGSRALLRDYGSRLFDLLDRPVTPELLAAVQAESAGALARWEPRLRLRSVRARSAEQGHVVLDLEANLRSGGDLLRLEEILA